MMKRMILACALALAVVPAALGASPDASKNASAACTALKAKMGATAFAAAYASFGDCVSRYSSLEQQNLAAAESSCAAAQADANFAASHNNQTFAQYYGTGKNGANAMQHCVSQTAQASSKAEQQGRVNPSQTCRAQRAANATAFNQTYGGKANAYGKCVSLAAHKQSGNELNAAGACKSEQLNAATFASTYGSDENAFGKCVSAKAQAAAAAQQQATIAAEKACLAEKNANAAAFATKYGSFGRCVSTKNAATK